MIHRPIKPPSVKSPAKDPRHQILTHKDHTSLGYTPIAGFEYWHIHDRLVGALLNMSVRVIRCDYCHSWYVPPWAAEASLIYNDGFADMTLQEFLMKMAK